MLTLTRKKVAVLAGLLALVSAVAIAIGSTSAVFTSSVTNPNNIFTTGTVSITDSPTDTVVTMANMAPGDVEYGELTILNNGTLPLTYTATNATTGAPGLSGALDLEVKVGATCTAAGWGAGGTLLTAPGNKFTAGTLFSTGRPLAAGANEKLCFRVALPLATTSATAAGQTTTGTFTFNGTQS